MLKIKSNKSILKIPKKKKNKKKIKKKMKILNPYGC